MYRVITMVLLAACLSACGSGGAQPRPRLIVAAAASLTPVIEPLAQAYERDTGTRVELNLAASSTIAAQMIAGAPIDLFISADQAQMDRVDEAGLIHAGTRVDLLGNRLVVVAPTGSTLEVRSLAALVAAVGRIALADPAAVPAGVYARRYLESAGVWHQLQGRLVPTRSVRAALITVEAGEVDVGIVYRTDALSSDRVTELFAVPATEGPEIRYPAAVAAESGDPESAGRLLAHLRGPQAGAVFEAAGFILVGSGP